jgi:hypothetical protein
MTIVDNLIAIRSSIRCQVTGQLCISSDSASSLKEKWRPGINTTSSASYRMEDVRRKVVQGPTICIRDTPQGLKPRSF